MFNLSRLNDCDSFSENHVLVFFIQLIMVLTVFFTLGSALLPSSNPEAYDREKGRLGSYIALFESHGVEHKELTPIENVIAHIVISKPKVEERFPTLEAETDKLIDIKHHGVWLNKGQAYLASDLFYSMLICGIICLIVGWGALFQVLRAGAAICLEGMISCIATGIFIPLCVVPLMGIALLAVVAGFAYPVILSINLILGIIQIIMTLVDKYGRKSNSISSNEYDWKTA